MILVELTAAVDAVGTLKTFYLSDENFVTAPTDTPADVAFDAALLDPGSIGINAFGDGRTGGGTKLEIGEMIIANNDGTFDDWLNYSFDGRPAVIRYGQGGPYPASFQTILTCTVDAVEASFKQIVVRLRDKQYLFTQQLLSNRYGGTNVLPDGVDGTAADLKDKVKPRVFGSVLNITPAFVNTSKLTYQVNDGLVADIPAVYDRGVALTRGADFNTIAALQASTPAAASYVTCLAEGLFRLGSAFAGLITADVVERAAPRTVGQTLRSIAMLAGVPPSDVSSADVDALDVVNPALIGIYINGTDTFQAVMDQVALSIGAYYGFDANGMLRMGVLTEPTGAEAVTIYPYDILSDVSRRSPKDNGREVWSVTNNYGRVWTVQASDLAGSVQPDRKAFLALQYRTAAATDPAVKNRVLLAGTIENTTLLVDADAAAAEAARQLALFKVRRSIYEIPVDLSVVTSNPVGLINVVKVVIDRFGLSRSVVPKLTWAFNSTSFSPAFSIPGGTTTMEGKLFRLIGFRVELIKKRAILTVWG